MSEDEGAGDIGDVCGAVCEMRYEYNVGGDTSVENCRQGHRQ